MAVETIRQNLVVSRGTLRVHTKYSLSMERPGDEQLLWHCASWIAKAHTDFGLEPEDICRDLLTRLGVSAPATLKGLLTAEQQGIFDNDIERMQSMLGMDKLFVQLGMCSLQMRPEERYTAFVATVHKAQEAGCLNWLYNKPGVGSGIERAPLAHNPEQFVVITWAELNA